MNKHNTIIKSFKTALVCFASSTTPSKLHANNVHNTIIKSLKTALVCFASSTTASKLHADNVHFIANDF
jgi:hypothetical protein